MAKKFWNDTDPKPKRDLHLGWWIAAALAIGILIGWIIEHGGIE